jgi:WD40 repeat protein
MYRLLLVDGKGEAITAQLRIRTLREFSGLDGVSVHFRPVRNDRLFESAKIGGGLAYRILFGENIVRSQLWVEFDVVGDHVNVTGRSADLLFALALVTSKWTVPGIARPAIAATGVLDPEGKVQSVERAVQKIEAAVRDLQPSGNAIVFYPVADAREVDTWRATTDVPAYIQLRAVADLDEALAQLGYVLEKVYLGNPFRGLEHFDYEHHAIFFGRDYEIRELLKQLLRREEAGMPGLLIEGPSGSGKSSFIRAGVLPALIDPRHEPEEIQALIGVRPISIGARRAVWRPGRMAIGCKEQDIVRSILGCWAEFPELAVESSDAPCETLELLARGRRDQWPANMRFVWLIDQFEEILTLGFDDAVLEELWRFLATLQADGVWTLACIRADAMPELKRFDTLRNVFGMNEGQYYLATLNGVALDDVINLPARAANLTFGVGPDGQRLDQLLREEAYREQDSLPLLQFTLNELYLRRSGNELTYLAYQELGGLAGSIATTAAAVLKFDGTEGANARLFRTLVSVDETGRATRRYAQMFEIMRDPQQRERISRLVDARLCVTDERDDYPVVAFAHDSLLRTLPPLIEWLKREAALLQTRELAQRDARLWREHGEKTAWLAASDKLIGFQALDAAGIALPRTVRRFIDRSENFGRRNRRIKRAAVSMIAVFAIAASIGAWIASKKGREAEYQTQQTLTAQARLLTEAAAQHLKDADVAGAQGIILQVLTNAKFALDHTPEAISVFQEVRAADPRLAVLAGHADRVKSAAYSPDGTRIVTASFDHTARIWDARTGAPLLLISGHGDYVESAVFSPDGTRIVSASKDKTARIWDALTGAPLNVLTGHSDTVHSAAFSPDGTRIVTASFDKTVRIWDAVSGAPLLTIPGDGAFMESAAFSPDGTRVVTAASDKTARVWNSRTGRPLAIMSGHSDFLTTAAYSPDGKRIITASVDKTARIWDAASGAPLSVLNGHGDIVNAAAYSPDGTRIVTASDDSTARIWDARSGAQLAIIRGHSSRVHDAVFSPDGTRIVTASFDGTARTWNAIEGDQVGVIGGVGVGRLSTAQYSPDGKRIATSSVDKLARIWDSRTGSQLAALRGHRDWLSDAQYSRDGTRLVTASFDRSARIWDVEKGAPLAMLSGHTDVVQSAVFSPDGKRVVTACDDNTARIWDSQTGQQLSVLRGHIGPVNFAAYSPDGTRVVTASADKSTRIWDARTGAQLAVLRGHDDHVSSASYSPDGARILTASYDKTARIWDARTGVQILELVGHEDRLNAATYSADGMRIVTASYDRTARIWDAHSGVQLGVLRGHIDIVNSAAYSPDGTRIVTASDDQTARTWDARVPADIEIQILWNAAAAIDPLPDVERGQLGLMSDAPVAKSWTQGSACDQATSAFYDPDRLARGVAQETIVADVASSACFPENGAATNSARLIYERGRALLAKSDVKGAKLQFELAVSKGYRAARVDLADLLVNDSAGMLDPDRAVSLYQEAWRDGVPIAAFELGHLYEYGVSGGADVSGSGKLQPDIAKAWYWYKQGVGTGEPAALSRFAEREERNALGEQDPAKRYALLFRAFSFYAAAAERAKEEDWPDDAWRNWRYRRATLARVLAREGMMQEVAAAYEAVLKAEDVKGPMTNYTAAISVGNAG